MSPPSIMKGDKQTPFAFLEEEVGNYVFREHRTNAGLLNYVTIRAQMDDFERFKPGPGETRWKAFANEYTDSSYMHVSLHSEDKTSDGPHCHLEILPDYEEAHNGEEAPDAAIRQVLAILKEKA
jgi:hypothetical protein